MANIEKLIPSIIRWEVGITQKKGESNKDLFQRAKLSENGFVNDPDDAGGATCIGVTINTYALYCRKKGYPIPTIERLKAIDYETWLAILKTTYWNRWMADEINNQSIAEYLVDWTWNSGSHGIKIPQCILKVTVDGFVGPKTIAAVNSADQKKFHAALVRERILFLQGIVRRTPSQEKFLDGWINRAESFKFEE